MNDNNNLDASVTSDNEIGCSSYEDNGNLEYIQSLDLLILRFSQMEERAQKKLVDLRKLRKLIIRLRQKAVSKSLRLDVTK